MSGEKEQKIDSDSLWWGLILIGFGVMLLLGRLGITDFGSLMHRFWPMFVIFLGVSRLFKRRSLWSGLWLITIGLWLQISTLGLFGLDFRSSWPLLLVALGAGMVVRTLVESARGRDAAAKENRHE
ncbi:MAG: transrane protein [Acidobacteria bacterium]|nr:transrane protein [Acidobacteriota bacterium]